jgi:hypothetical protein
MDIKEVLEKHRLWLTDDPNGLRADLRGANLRGANLRWADLRGADLRGANLLWADLRWALGNFAIGYFGKHYAVAAGGYISIGCIRKTYIEWLERYEAIGQENGYTPEEIGRYGAWIKLVVDWLEPLAGTA